MKTNDQRLLHLQKAGEYLTELLRVAELWIAECEKKRDEESGSQE